MVSAKKEREIVFLVFWTEKINNNFNFLGQISNGFQKYCLMWRAIVFRAF